MTMELATIGWGCFGLLTGTGLGLAFGAIQRRAQERHERLVTDGHWKGARTLLPGSARRVAFLLLALVAIQVLCPMLFKGGTEWWVSSGVALGYGCALWRQLVRAKGRQQAEVGEG